MSILPAQKIAQKITQKCAQTIELPPWDLGLGVLLEDWDSCKSLLGMTTSTMSRRSASTWSRTCNWDRLFQDPSPSFPRPGDSTLNISKTNRNCESWRFHELELIIIEVLQGGPSARVGWTFVLAVPLRYNLVPPYAQFWMGNWQNWRSSWARWWNIICRSKSTQPN